ncbi:methyl-accepting chemotaxis protein [Pacificimonas aurantium]|nr:nitrate- and nitrite sensing domain-containing protein [Pacificimonas aurantium]MBZ6378783.1 nitrate- and nitrite sensing domain-containing protein [Pacificimonas aurantium]
MSISRRLLLISVFPALAALFLIAGDVSSLFDQRAQAVRLAGAAHIAAGVSDLVHELQRERGLSAGYTGSGGAKFAEELPRQRAATDASLAALETELADYEASAVSEEAAEHVLDLQNGVRALSTMRGRIDDMALTVPELAGAYTGLVNDGLRSIETLLEVGSDEAQSREADAYLAVIHAKEDAGLERAMGATGFGAGAFPAPIYRKFVSLIALQDDEFRRFGLAATAEQIAELERVLASPASQTVQQFRDGAHRSALEGEPLNVDAARWWTAITKKIDDLKTIDSSIGEHMVAVADAQKRSADLQLLLNALAILLVGGVLATLVFLIGRSIVVPLRQIGDATDSIARGQLDDALPLPAGRNELVDLGQSVDALRSQLKAAEEAKAEQTRLICDSIGTGLDALAKGDLTHRVEADLIGPFAGLKQNFNQAVDGLHDLMGSIVRTAVEIRASSSEISQASEDLARRTESNAASLEQTAATLCDVEGRLQSTASAAGETVRQADEAMARVGDGRAIAADAVQAMSRVSESAEGIDTVIEGLDKIAFQTRVLAMNAAVEAGRAGEAGRGFAVVADLVSSLAMRAEEEAKNARSQLTVTQTEVGLAVESVERVDGALDTIHDGVNKVNELLGRMAEDNQAQSSSLSEISSAVNTMDKSTQQNAAMVEETSAAARNLDTEIDALVGHTERFKTSVSSERDTASRPAGGRLSGPDGWAPPMAGTVREPVAA